MGLDIHALSHVKRVDSTELCEGQINVYLDKFNRIEGLEVGIYEHTDKSEFHDFKAGAYSSYNWFRNHLSLMIYGHPSVTVWENEDAFEGRPFYELIDFSDCDGIIGTTVCQKLFNDFETNRSSMIKYCLDNFIDNDDVYDDIMGTYDNFTQAFKVASNGGLVQFT